MFLARYHILNEMKPQIFLILLCLPDSWLAGHESASLIKGIQCVSCSRILLGIVTGYNAALSPFLHWSHWHRTIVENCVRLCQCVSMKTNFPATKSLVNAWTTKIKLFPEIVGDKMIRKRLLWPKNQLSLLNCNGNLNIAFSKYKIQKKKC